MKERRSGYQGLDIPYAADILLIGVEMLDYHVHHIKVDADTVSNLQQWHQVASDTHSLGAEGHARLHEYAYQGIHNSRHPFAGLVLPVRDNVRHKGPHISCCYGNACAFDELGYAGDEEMLLECRYALQIYRIFQHIRKKDTLIKSLESRYVNSCLRS